MEPNETKPTHLQVEDHRNLVREVYSKAIINDDRDAFAEAKRRKEAILAKDTKLEGCVEDINTLKQDLSSVKATLETLVKLLSREKE